MATTPGSKLHPPQRRLEQAVEYVSRTWFPVNPDVFAAIQATLQAGKYDNNLTALIQDIKKDFSVFTYCLKGIRDLYPPGNADKSPFAVLKVMDHEVLKKLISVPSTEISSHDFLAMERAQSTRLKHMVLSCSTAELLAMKNSLNPDEVYTLTVLRQLGMNLVAWNYPSIYQRALQTLRNGSELELDDILADLLGFTPKELAAELTLPVEMRERNAIDLGLVSQEGETEILSVESDSLSRKMCEIGEAFAVLNDPEQHPSGTSRSKTVIAEINHILGPQSLNLIREVMNRKYVSYVKHSPEIFAVNSAIESNIQRASFHYGAVLYSKNQYVTRTPEELQRRIREVYSRLSKGQVSTEGIQMLASDLLPSVGFQRGCIFLLDQKRLFLMPRLRIGNDSVSRYKTYNCGDSLDMGNPIVDALTCSYPIKQENTFFNGEGCSLIAGALGGHERAGVLYLEMSDKLVENAALEPLAIFKALRQCFNDCLNLR